MVKLNDLKIQQLKAELEERKLPVNGQKVELQARLRNAMEAEGINVDEFVFEGAESSTKVEGKLEEQRTPPNTDMNMILAAMQQIIQQNSQEMESRITQQMTGITQQIAANESRLTEQISEVTGQLMRMESNAAQLQVRQIKVEEELQTLNQRVDAVDADFHKMETEISLLNNRVQELQLSGPVTTMGAPKLKAPSFDGSTPFQIFKLQFEKTATTNNWSAESKAATLIVSLKGSAAEVLQTIPDSERDNYEALMRAIERRYGSEHRRQIYQIELQNRGQKANESLQEFATEIERLAHLANADAPMEYIERMKIQSFINGIRDVDTKRATYAMPKKTFAETVAHALTQETASLLSKPAYKVHKVEVEQPCQSTMEEILKTLKTMAVPRVNSGKCFNCGKMGHLARNCNVKPNPAKRKRASEEDGEESATDKSLN